MRNLTSEISAIMNSHRFAPFMKGVAMALPNGDYVEVKVRRVRRSIRPIGLRLSRYAFETEVVAGKAIGTGFGEAESKLVALQKSIAEGVERAIFRSLAGTRYGTPNSNGWAAHINPRAVWLAAQEELLERDAVLVHWLCKVPMRELPVRAGPAWLRRWIDRELTEASEFQTLKVLVSDRGYLPTVTTVLLSRRGNAVLSHAAEKTLEGAAYKALAETCRIAQIAEERIHFDSSRKLGTTAAGDGDTRFIPEDHVMLYAYHRELPQWLIGQTQSWQEAQKQWVAHRDRYRRNPAKVDFHEVASGPLAVGYCTSHQVQQLFFGPTEGASRRGLLNLRRLEAARSNDELNFLPHCVA